MSKDRLSEFNSSYEMQQSFSSSTNTEFDLSVADIKAAIERINENTQYLKTMHKKSLLSTSSKNGKSFHLTAVSSQLDQTIHDTGLLISEARNEIKALATLPGDISIKQIMQKNLTRKLLDSAREYQIVQQNAKKEYRKQLERQIRIAAPDATNQQIEDAISNGGNVFQNQLLTSRTTLDQVQHRQSELELLEQSLVELFELMQDMQMMLQVCIS